MCGRFTHMFTWAELYRLLSITSPPPAEPLAPSYNVAPSQAAPIAVHKAGSVSAHSARWGLVPSWAKDASIGHRCINARCETAATSPAYRAAFAARRCVVPASGFYEWQRLQGPQGESKQPMYLSRADGQPLLMAGLWEAPLERLEMKLPTFTIITTPANDFVRPIHDRMPAILEPEAVASWLSPVTTAAAAQKLLGPAPDGVLTAWPVGARVNNPRHNGEDLVQRV